MDKVIHHVTKLAGMDAAAAFSWFTQNQLLETWLTTQAQVEAAVGGKYELFWNPADREHDSTIGCRVVALTRDRLISFEWKGARQFERFMNSQRPLTNVTVSFFPQADGTEVHLLHSGWRAGPEWDEARTWFDGVWRAALSKLESHAAKLARGAADAPRVVSAQYLCAVLLVSKDPERLAKFYRDALGVPLEAEDHGGTQPHYGCEVGDLHFAIHPIENFEGREPGIGAVKLAFEVFDLTAFVNRLQSHGVQPLYPPRELGFCRMTAVRDPDDNEIELTQLADDWFGHLEKRRAQGFDIVQQWRRENRNVPR